MRQWLNTNLEQFGRELSPGHLPLAALALVALSVEQYEFQLFCQGPRVACRSAVVGGDDEGQHRASD